MHLTRDFELSPNEIQYLRCFDCKSNIKIISISLDLIPLKNFPLVIS